MRRNGRKPSMVWLSCDGYNAGFTRLAKLGFYPESHVELDMKDSPARVDFRFAVGLVVEVSGSDERRVGATARALVGSGAKQVIAACHTMHRRGEEFEADIDRITFTNEEVSQWPM